MPTACACLVGAGYSVGEQEREVLTSNGNASDAYDEEYLDSDTVSTSSLEMFETSTDTAEGFAWDCSHVVDEDDAIDAVDSEHFCKRTLTVDHCAMEEMLMEQKKLLDSVMLKDEQIGIQQAIIDVYQSLLTMQEKRIREQEYALRHSQQILSTVVGESCQAPLKHIQKPRPFTMQLPQMTPMQTSFQGIAKVSSFASPPSFPGLPNLISLGLQTTTSSCRSSTSGKAKRETKRKRQEEPQLNGTERHAITISRHIRKRMIKSTL